MSNKQETLIYIEKETIAEADFMSGSFVSKEVKNRAYINTLGAELVIKYLKSEGIDIENPHNIHSISKIIESIDISDIILPNVHIDVRTVFDKSQIFIPKSHSELGITPDIYAVLVLDPEFKYCELAGYFTPDKIDKNNANSSYYFIEADKLSSPDTFAAFVKNFEGNTTRELSETEFFKGRELSVTLADHNATTDDIKKLLSLLMASETLRESVIEYDNFETLAYNTVKEADFSDYAQIVATTEIPTAETVLEETEEETLSDSENNFEDSSNSEENSNEEEEEEENSDAFDTVDFGEFESFEDEENNNINEDFLDELNQAVEESSQETETFEQQSSTDETNVAEEASIEELAPIDTLEEISPDDFSSEAFDFDEDLSLDIDATDDTEDKKESEKTKTDAAKTITETALAAGTAAAAGAAIAGAAEIAAAAGATTEAIKLAGVSGEILEDLLEQNVENQQKHLDKIDYTNIDVNAEEIPEEIASIISVPTKTASEEEYVTPTDLSELKPVENPMNKEEVFEHETVDLHAMETVQTEEIPEINDDVVNLNNINFNSPTTPAENLHEIMNTHEDEGINLPDVSTYSLDEPSPHEELAMNTLIESEQHLTDFPPATLPETDILNNEDTDMLLDIENAETLTLADIPAENTETDIDVNLDKNIAEDISTDMLAELPSLDIDNLSLDEDISEPAIEPEFGFDQDSNKQEQDEPEANIELEEEEEEKDISLEELDDIETLQAEDFLQENDTELIEEPQPIEDIGEISDFDTTDEITDIEDFTEAKPEEDEFANLDDISELSDIEDIENFEQSEELSNTDEVADIEQTDEFASFDELPDNVEDSEEISEPELDEEFSTDLNTEFDSDETLHDADPVKDLENNAIIENPEEQIPAVLENSIVITDKNFTVGEIPIDINVVNKPNIEDAGALGSIYNTDNESAPSMLQTPGRTGKNLAPSKTGLGIIGGLLTLVIVCVIGFGVAKMFKAPTEETPQPTTDDALPTDTLDEQTPSADALKVDTNNVVNMNNNTDALATTQTPAPAPVAQSNTPKVQPSTAAKAAPARKALPPTAFLEVKKLSWEVPDYIAYNPQFKQYFQAAGRSLKLSLTTDLLLAKEYAYTNELKVTITFNKDGSFKEAKIIKSSGSTQIDRIVLQTVNQTLNVLKAPSSVGNDENTVAILKIYL